MFQCVCLLCSFVGLRNADRDDKSLARRMYEDAALAPSFSGTLQEHQKAAFVLYSQLESSSVFDYNETTQAVRSRTALSGKK